MDLRTAFAGVLRALRLVRGARYADVSDATHRRKVSALENAQTSITVEQFDELAQSLGIDPIAMLTLCIAHRQGEQPLTVIGRALTDVAAFEAEGGMKVLSEQFDADATYQGSYAAAIAHFVDALDRGKPFETSPADNLETLRLVEEIYRRAAFDPDAKPR